MISWAFPKNHLPRMPMARKKKIRVGETSEMRGNEGQIARPLDRTVLRNN